MAIFCGQPTEKSAKVKAHNKSSLGRGRRKAGINHATHGEPPRRYVHKHKR